MKSFDFGSRSYNSLETGNWFLFYCWLFISIYRCLDRVLEIRFLESLGLLFVQLIPAPEIWNNRPNDYQDHDTKTVTYQSLKSGDTPVIEPPSSFPYLSLSLDDTVTLTLSLFLPSFRTTLPFQPRTSVYGNQSPEMKQGSKGSSDRCPRLRNLQDPN